MNKHLIYRFLKKVVNLEHQYRMNADIMKLCNYLTYGYRLRCGNQDVASRYPIRADVRVNLI